MPNLKQESSPWTDADKQQLLDTLASLMLAEPTLTIPITRSFRPVALELIFR